MDIEPVFICCWGCPVAPAPVVACILFSLIALGLGGVFRAKAGPLAHGLGLGLSAIGLLGGLAALYSIVRFGIAWDAGWSFSPPGYPWLASSPEEASRHRLYSHVFAVASLVSMIVTWIAVPRIVSGREKAASAPDAPRQMT